MNPDLSCSETLSSVTSDDLNLDGGVKSLADPTLVNDSRVLSNVLAEGSQTSVKVNYFLMVQPEVKPHMRKIVADWMLEVTEEQQCQPEVGWLVMIYILDLKYVYTVYKVSGLK